ncbi:unnamed protein product [Gordionus sp. m RMFG-2023]|uniref:coiled-coil domain-containing protein 12-like n=1 Tax=Gordionus sp. m RMFG-2023 TaxID=3053472 RepID=UPI0030DF8391
MIQEKNIGTLADEARKRKQKLFELKKKKQENNENSENLIKHKKPIFRNYAPTDTELQSSMLPKVKPSALDEKIEEQISLTTQPEEKLTNKIEMNLSTLAPRKIDWDLKRDISKKLEKLERKTQQAISELIREQIMQTKDLSSMPDMDTT